MILLVRAAAVALRRQFTLLAVFCSVGLTGCGLLPSVKAPTANPPLSSGSNTSAAATQLRLAQQRCRAGRETLQDSLAALRRDEARLAALRARSFVPEPPPPPFDESAAARLTREDADLDRERHENELNEWRERNVQRRATWQSEQAARLNDAQAALDQRAAALRARHPRLFSAADSIEVVPSELARLNRCDKPNPDQQKQASR